MDLCVEWFGNNMQYFVVRIYLQHLLTNHRPRLYSATLRLHVIDSSTIDQRIVLQYVNLKFLQISVSLL